MTEVAKPGQAAQPTPALSSAGTLLDILNAATALVSDDAFAAERRDLRAIGDRMVSPVRRLVAIGEEGRGKTRLVNQLVGMDVVDSAPTMRPVLVTTGLAGADGPWDTVRYDGQLLDGMVDEILDTVAPSADPDDEAESGGMVIEELRTLVVTASVVVMVISGTSPFSLTERGLLQAVMADRLGRSLLVVVTMLDRVEAGERESVVRSVRQKTHRLAPEATVLAADDDAALRSAVRAVESSGRQARIEWDEATARLLRQVLLRIVQVAAARAEAVAEDAVQAEERSQEDARIFRRQGLEWDTLLARLDTRRGELLQRLAASRQNSADKIRQQMEADLRMSPDPSAWWRDHLQTALRTELESAARLFERRLTDALGTDLEWLSAEVGRITGDEPIVLLPEVVGLEVVRLHTRAPSMPNVTLLRSGTVAAATILFTAKVAMSGAIAAVLPAAALGGAAFAVGTLVTRGGTKRAADAGAAAIDQVVEECLESLLIQVETAVEASYRHLRDSVGRVRRDWRAVRAAGPRTAHGRDRDWSEIRSAAAELATDLDNRWTEEQRG